MFTIYKPLRIVTPLAFIVVLLFALLWILRPFPTTHAQSQPEALGSISGLVRNRQGEPLPNIGVSLYGSISGYPGQFVLTDAQGSYRILFIPPGSYHVKYVDGANIYATTYYTKAAVVGEATSVNVSGNDVTGIDGVMPPGATISVTVATVAEARAYIVQAVLYRKTPTNYFEEYDKVRWESDYAEAFPDQVFVFDAIYEGTYRICVSAILVPWSSSLAECYENVVPDRIGEPSAGKDIVISANEHKTVAFLLGDFSQLQGIVKSTTGEAMPNVTVNAWSDTSPTEPTVVRTDAQGQFYFPTLWEDQYTVGAEAAGYLPTFYNSTTIREEATRLVIGPTSRYSMTLTMQLGGIVTGTVLLDGHGIGAEVIALSSNCSEMEWPLCTVAYANGVTGVYTITALPTGSYRIKATFNPDGTHPIQGYYGGKESQSAVPISVTAGKITPNINIILGENRLEFEGSIMGSATANGVPKAGIQVGLWFYDSNYHNFGWTIVPRVATSTNAEGKYRFDGLASGTYAVGFRDPQGVYATTLFDQQYLHPTPVMITGTQILANVNATLSPGSTIRGTIRRTEGKNPAGYRIHISAENPGETLYFLDIISGTTGDYEITGLPPGTYWLFASPPYPASGWYERGSIVVGENVTLEGIDFMVDALPRLFLPMVEE